MEAAFPLIFLFCFAFTRSSSDPGPMVPAVASGGVCWLQFLYLMRGFHTFPPSAVCVAKPQRGSVPGAVLGRQELPSVSFTGYLHSACCGVAVPGVTTRPGAQPLGQVNAGLCPSCMDVWAGAPLHESDARGVRGHHLPTTSLEPSLEYLKAQNQACRSALLNAEVKAVAGSETWPSCGPEQYQA